MNAWANYTEGKNIPKEQNWKRASVTSIAKSLFVHHGFDADRAVAIAYWFKKGKMISHDYVRYWAKYPQTSTVQITDEEAVKLLEDYNGFCRGFPVGNSV